MNRRLLFGTVCVEAVAAISVLTYGPLSLVAVAVLYWFDLFFVVGRALIQQLVARPVVPPQATSISPPFRLLRYKRGALTVVDSLPPFYLRRVPKALGAALVLAISVATTAYVAVVEVPAALWTDPVTPFVLGGGVVAAATKSWTALGTYIDAGVHEDTPAYAVTPGKRVLLFVVYAGLLLGVSVWTVGVLEDGGAETARTAFTVFALVVVALRLAYGISVSWTWRDRHGPKRDPERSTTEDDGLVSRLRSALTADEEVIVPSPVSVPNGDPLTVVTPSRRSILAAAVVNAMTTGGVVDGQFSHYRAVGVRVGMLLFVPVAVLALLDGAVAVSLALLGILLGVVVVLSAVSAVHMLLALRGLEYRFYDSAVVAYDRFLDEPQWVAPYSRIRDVSVERGLFGSPLWLDAGTVSLRRFDPPALGALRQQEGGLVLAFVPDPERVGEYLRSHDEHRERRPQ